MFDITIVAIVAILRYLNITKNKVPVTLTMEIYPRNSESWGTTNVTTPFHGKVLYKNEIRVYTLFAPIITPAELDIKIIISAESVKSLCVERNKTP